MDTEKFLEEIKKIENKLCQKAGEEPGQLKFIALVELLKKTGQIDEQMVILLKKIWVFRNKIYAVSTPDQKISDEVKTLLDSITSNFKLQ